MILVVDDDAIFRGSIADLLIEEGYQALEASDALEALSCLRENPHIEVVFSDVKMPDMDGLALLHEIKLHYPTISVVMLTGHGEVGSAVQAMREGALNYLLKPANRQQILSSTQEAFAARASTIQKQNLMSQVMAGLQQLGMAKPDPVPTPIKPETRFIQVRDLVIDQYRLVATLADVGLDLTPTEFELLTYLAHAQGRVVAFEELVYQLQGIQAPRDEARSMLSTHLSNLRAKLREAGGEDYIINSRGYGYFLNFEA